MAAQKSSRTPIISGTLTLFWVRKTESPSALINHLVIIFDDSEKLNRIHSHIETAFQLELAFLAFQQRKSFEPRTCPRLMTIFASSFFLVTFSDREAIALFHQPSGLHIAAARIVHVVVQCEREDRLFCAKQPASGPIPYGNLFLDMLIL